MLIINDDPRLAAEVGADVNHDGGVDGGDVETFFVIWQAGGC
jgi:thiamine monophosphate synthase